MEETMPTAICSKCLNTRYWRNTRGSSISGQTCECGGQIVAAVFDEATQKYSPRGNQSKNTGRKFEHCALCGKRRTIPGGGRRVEKDSLWHVVVGNYSEGWKDYYASVKAGSIVCWSHEQNYPVFLPPNHGLQPDVLSPREAQPISEIARG